MKTKECIICWTVKPMSEFPAKGGRLCRLCDNARTLRMFHLARDGEQKAIDVARPLREANIAKYTARAEMGVELCK